MLLITWLIIVAMLTLLGLIAGVDSPIAGTVLLTLALCALLIPAYLGL